MIISKKQYNKLPLELQECFISVGGDGGVGRNTHPT